MGRYVRMGIVLSMLAVGGVSSAFAAGNASESGEQLYKNPGRGGCIQCHGEAGNGPVIPMYPKIGGQSEIYLYNQMIDYKAKRRKNGLYVPMEVAMQPFSDDEIRAMAQYLAQQKTF
ncbi:cytochrome c [Photobacterium japonica]|uniref:c-type cytochrome n=1 Tax=Photobacterium japonica TaxID=2910235 RepID=UPI003D0CE164